MSTTTSPPPNLVYIGGGNPPISQPYKSLAEFQLPPDVIKTLTNLNLGDNTLGVIDFLMKAAAPNIANGSDAIIVSQDIAGNESKFKRALSYFLPILKKIIPPPHSIGPQLLLVCSSVCSAMSFEKKLKSLLNGTPSTRQLKVQMVYSNMMNFSKLVKSADVLITNIDTISELLFGPRESRVYYRRLKYLVLEDIDCYLATHSVIVSNAVAFANKKSAPIQLIVCGTKWTSDLKVFHLDLLKKGRNPLVCMEGLAEIMKFGLVQWRVDDASEEKGRLEVLKDTVTQRMSTHKRSVIACATMEEAKIIQNFCRESKVPSKIVTAELKQTGTAKNLGKNQNEILIVTDDLITSANIEGCTYLLSFNSGRRSSADKSSESQTIERSRLWYLWPSLPKLVNGEWVSSQKELVAHFMMTGEESHFLKFYNFSTGLNNTFIDPRLVLVGQELVAKELPQMAVCNGISLYGTCNIPSATPKCSYRHDFLETDFVPVANAPSYGEIEFDKIHSISPSEYFGTLAAHYNIDKTGKRVLITSFQNELSRRTELLNEFFKSSEDATASTETSQPEPPSTISKGDLFAIKTEKKSNIFTTYSYKRVRVVWRFLKYVNLLCVDTGEEIRGKLRELLTLPEDYAMWPPLYLKIILTNISPPKGEPNYLPPQIAVAKELLAGVSNVTAQVVLSKENTVWVKNLSFIKKINGQPKKQYVHPLLIQFKSGIENNTHESRLIASFQKVGTAYHGYMNLPKKVAPRKPFDQEIFNFRKKSEEIQWAHLETNVSAQIMTTYVINPWLLHGVNMKYRSILHHLEKELHSWIQEQEAEGRREEEEFFEGLEPGSVVAAKERATGKWKRALIIAMEREDEDVYYYIFFVDFGDDYVGFMKEEIHPIPTKFVGRLPFQVMAFSLNHIQPRDRSRVWSKKEIDAFMGLVIPNGESVVVDVAVIKKVEDEEEDPQTCRYYEAVVFLQGKEVGSLLLEDRKARKGYDVNEFVENLETSLNEEEEVPPLSDVVDDEDEGGQDDLVARANRSLNFNENDDDFEEFLKRFDINIPDRNFNSVTSEAPWDSQCQSELCNTEKVESSLQSTSSSSLKPASGSMKAIAEASTATVSSPNAHDGNVGLLHPTVYWHQTQTQLILTIQHPDIQEYNLKIGKDQRTIRCLITKPPNYGFTLKSFGKIKMEPEDELLTGQELKIKLGKRLQTADPWCRVLSDKTLKYRWLKEHPAFLEERKNEAEDDVESDEDEEDMYQYKVELHRVLGNDPNFGDLDWFLDYDDDDNQDEDGDDSDQNSGDIENEIDLEFN
ncbi:unnamed protein product [Orchesella dallaii]|uniref:RNA helicase n=1 Tax=Orchesella dallaii TaxID=48710 RepID=A0ABP1S752_9HEXA